MIYNVNITLYTPQLKLEVQRLRRLGKTFCEINTNLNTKIPKSTLSGWCVHTTLPPSYSSKIIKTNQNNLKKARKIAQHVKNQNRQTFLQHLDTDNLPIAQTIQDNSVGMIALAMLCLGEASKSKTKHRSFSLGSSDPRIITIFLQLLKRFDTFDPTKIRCTVQCRADQNIVYLEKYWQKITKVPKSLFYATRTDPRTIGKPTTNQSYKGVVVIDYYDRKIQLILESLAELVYNQLQIKGP